MVVNTVLESKRAGKLSIRQLFEPDIPALQQLCVECSDFHQLTKGSGPSDQEGTDLMQDCPPGKSPEDKIVFGVFSPQEKLLGVCELMRDYPEQDTWYIGLMLLHPEWRGVGLGQDLLAWVEHYLTSNKGQALMVAVLDVNPRGKKFWQESGFEHLRQVENYQSGNITTKALVMRKVL